jgi:hypothetical protein
VTYDGLEIGTAPTDPTTGAFSLSVSGSSVAPACGKNATPGTLRVTSSSGGVTETTGYICR